MSSGAWEKCARLLLLNSANDVVDLVEVLEKVVTNILKNPSESKFKTIKTSNKVVQSKVLSKHGGLELFLAFGFISVTDMEGNKVLRLSEDTFLESGLRWLKNTSQVCIEFASSKSDGSTARCCECEIQLRLPIGGSSVSGGFMKGDTLKDVKDFAMCFFQESRSHLIQLKIPPGNRSVTEEELSLSLEQLDLCPRAVLLVTALSDAEHSELLDKAHTNAQYVEVKKTFDESAAKRKKQDERDAEQKNREKVLQAFKEDRERRLEKNRK